MATGLAARIRRHAGADHDAVYLDDGERAVGYVIGTPDTAAFARAYRERWIPRLADRYPVPPEPPVTPDEQMLALHYRPERLLRAQLPRYPAHLHVDLLPDLQGRGYGRQLIDTFAAAVAEAGAAGVHVCVASANTPALGFYERIGFTFVEADGPVTYLGRALPPPAGWRGSARAQQHAQQDGALGLLGRLQQ